MKYIVLFTRGEREERPPDAEQQQHYAAIWDWWRRLIRGGKMVLGHQLAPAYTATAVVFNGHDSELADGPYAPASERLSGYCLLDLSDLDEALAIVRSFPSPNSRAEIRPVIESRSLSA